MNKASRIFLIFAVVVFVLQWLVPATMIIGHEMVLEKGEEIKIRCQPIDPVDPFRGRYVSIRLDLALPDNFEQPADTHKQQHVFARLRLDEQGFAVVDEVLTDEPSTDLYVTGQVQGWRKTFAIGLDRYYMNERLAPEAERLVRSGIREDSKVWASVKIFKGRAVLSGLYVDGIAIEELARERLDQSE